MPGMVACAWHRALTPTLSRLRGRGSQGSGQTAFARAWKDQLPFSRTVGRRGWGMRARRRTKNNFAKHALLGHRFQSSSEKEYRAGAVSSGGTLASRLTELTR